MEAKSYWDSTCGRLYVELDNVVYDLTVRGRITIISDMNSSGKTYLLNSIMRLHGSGILLNVAGVNVRDGLIIDDLVRIMDSLIVLDNADALSDNVIDYIRRNRGVDGNTYLIFCRTYLNLGLSPNYFGEFVRNDGVVSIKYAFSERGWF